MRRLMSSILAAACIASGHCHAQTFDEVCASPSRYIWAEGWGRSVQEADTQALSSLCSAVSVSVTSTYRLVESDRRTSRGHVGESIAESNVSVISCATLEGSGMEVLSRGRRAHVARWISREDVDKMLDEREARVKDLVREAHAAAADGRIGAELDCLSQASALLAALPLADGVRMDIEGTGCVRLASWIPSRISSIIDGISVSIVSRAGNHITLAFTSRGHLVQGLDFSYFDGRSWSPVRHCPSGRTSVELAPGALGEHVQVMLANAPRDRGMKVVGK